jgi:hypothetical protein
VSAVEVFVVLLAQHPAPGFVSILSSNEVATAEPKRSLTEERATVCDSRT